MWASEVVLEGADGEKERVSCPRKIVNPSALEYGNAPDGYAGYRGGSPEAGFEVDAEGFDVCWRPTSIFDAAFEAVSG